MELLKYVRKRSFLSESIYVVLNILLAVALLIVTITTTVPWPAVGLVLLSKWRVFAVRTRYWIANIRANMIDTIVGMSVVTFLYQTNGELVLQIALTAGYTAWLLFVKPRSKRSFVAAQALIGLVVGIGAIVMISPVLPAFVVVLLSWIVAYSSARHVLSIQHETHINFLSLIWGFVIAELMWLAYHWTIGYDILGPLQLPQIMLIVAALAFLTERTYANYHKNGGVIKTGEIALPSLLCISVIAVLLFVFSGATTI